MENCAIKRGACCGRDGNERNCGGRIMRSFFKSAYVKAAGAFLLAGVLLIFIHNIITKTKFSSVITTINNTLAPIYIGLFIAFLFCPIFNRIVKGLYAHMVTDCTGEGGLLESISFGTNKPIENNEVRRHRRMLKIAKAIASIICILIMFAIIGLLGYFILPQIIDSIVKTVATVPEKLTELSSWSAVHLKKYPEVVKAINSIANAGSTEIIGWVQTHILKENAQNIAAQISTTAIGLLKMIVNIFVGILLAIYLLNFKEKLLAITRKLIAATCSEKKSQNLYEFGTIMNETFIGYIVGRILDAIVIGILTYFSMRLLNMPMAILVSVIVGVTNVIPFFGPFLGAIPSFCLLLLESPIQACYFAVLILIIQQLDGNVIGPKIVGNAIGMNSFWVLIAVLIGGGLFGFIGMALGVPVFAVIYRYVNKITESRLNKRERIKDTEYYYSFEQFGIENKEEIIGKEKNDK